MAIMSLLVTEMLPSWAQLHPSIFGVACPFLPGVISGSAHFAAMGPANQEAHHCKHTVHSWRGTERLSEGGLVFPTEREPISFPDLLS